jgi:hypothetical protein
MARASSLASFACPRRAPIARRSLPFEESRDGVGFEPDDRLLIAPAEPVRS